MRCGFCLTSCPTWVETKVETSSPRGRITLMRAVAEGKLDVSSPGFVHQMYECLDCRACENVCPGCAIRQAGRTGPRADREAGTAPALAARGAQGDLRGAVRQHDRLPGGFDLF
ncbi:MAG: (Fe-S)-binding protein [Chloroflexia bacterium]